MSLIAFEAHATYIKHEGSPINLLSVLGGITHDLKQCYTAGKRT